MEMGLIIICLFIIFIAACIMPWWYIPAMVGAIIFFEAFVKK